MLCLLACVATASIWAYFTRSEVTLTNAANLLVEDLHMAQSRALFLDTPVEVVFDADGRGYRVVDGQGGAPSGLRELDLTGRRYDIDAVFEGVAIARIEGAEVPSDPDDPGGERARRSVRFDATGAITRSVWITLAYRGETRTVQVDAQVGNFFVADAVRSMR